MKLDVTQKIYNYDGKPFQMEKDKDLTLRDVLLVALTAAPKQGEEISAEKKIHRDFLSREIYSNNIAEIPAGDIGEIQGLVNYAFGSPGVVAQAFALLDPKPEKVLKKDSEG